jgi:hypothetical protein
VLAGCRKRPVERWMYLWDSRISFPFVDFAGVLCGCNPPWLAAEIDEDSSRGGSSRQGCCRRWVVPLQATSHSRTQMRTCFGLLLICPSMGVSYRGEDLFRRADDSWPHRRIGVSAIRVVTGPPTGFSGAFELSMWPPSSDRHHSEWSQESGADRRSAAAAQSEPRFWIAAERSRGS